MSMDGSQKHYAKQRKPDTKREHTAWFYLYETLGKNMCSCIKQFSDCLGQGWKGFTGMGMKIYLGVIRFFCIFILVLRWVYTFVKTQ